MIVVNKWCLKCDRRKPIKNFNKRARSRDGFSTWCRECTSIVSKHYRETNPKTMSKLKKDWKLSNADREKQNNKGYHLTKYWPKLSPLKALIAYNSLLLLQNYKCKVCQRSKTEFKARFHVDHCHKTGKVRGLLCFNCNVMLGNSLDNVDTLKNAIEYLKSHK